MSFATIIVCCLLGFVCAIKNEGCVLSFTNPSTEKLLPVPLYNLSNHFELAVPDKGTIPLRKEQSITLLCSGPKNYLTLANSNVTSVSCIENTTLKLFRKTINFEDIQCSKTVKAEVIKTKQQCGNRQGFIYNIGYQATKKKLVTLIQLCHQPDSGNTLYSEHELHGKAIKYASRITYRPGFSTSGLNDSITASLAYKKAYQKSTFNKILESAALAENYVNSKSFLARGHLSPDADFLLASSQFSTYFYLNTAPQWQSINGGNWKSIESTIRKLAELYDNLLVTTGTFGVLELPDKHNKPKPIFLVSDNKLPVPKYFWKIAYEPVLKKGIVIIVLNNPFVNRIDKNDIFCPDICEEFGFRHSAWKNPISGYVFCCEVNRFQEKVKTGPSLTVNGVLSA